MAPFAEQVQIEIGEEERKSVRVEDFEGPSGVGAASNFVAADFGSGGLIGGPHGFEEALGTEFDGVSNFCRRDSWIFENDAGFGGPRNEKADGPSGGEWMRAEYAKGISVFSSKESINFCVKFRASELLRGQNA